MLRCCYEFKSKLTRNPSWSHAFTTDVTRPERKVCLASSSEAMNNNAAVNGWCTECRINALYLWISISRITPTIYWIIQSITFIIWCDMQLITLSILSSMRSNKVVRIVIAPHWPILVVIYDWSQSFVICRYLSCLTDHLLIRKRSLTCKLKSLYL